MYINKQMRTWQVEYISMLLKELVLICDVARAQSLQCIQIEVLRPLMSLGRGEADVIKNWIPSGNIFTVILVQKCCLFVKFN